MAESLILVLLAAFAWFAIDSMRARERAHAAGRNACQRNNLQFLDDTVAAASIKPARNSDGRLQLQRAYNFEFSDNGDNRISGSVVTLGRRVILLNVMPPRAPSPGVSNVIPLR